MICEICSRETDNVHKHHVVPKARGGRHGATVNCCPTCNKQVHLLFSNKELERMSLEELKSQESMQKYIKWIRKRKGDYKGRLSNHVKKR